MGKLTDRSLAPYVNLDSLIHIVNTGDTSQSLDGSSYKTPLSALSPLFGGGNTYWSASTGTNAIVVKYSNSLASGDNSLAEGSGTTARAAIQTERSYLGSEISKEYHDICVKRLEVKE
jgi:hypothetical protein